MTDKSPAVVEHVNFTVPDAEFTAAMLCDVFDWHIRWQGPAIDGGRSIHVGGKDSYLAVYSPANQAGKVDFDRSRTGHLNHIAVVVDDLDQVEERVKAKGYTPINHADYEPGRRFYFLDENETEFEVVSYT